MKKCQLYEYFIGISTDTLYNTNYQYQMGRSIVLFKISNTGNT